MSEKSKKPKKSDFFTPMELPPRQYEVGASPIVDEVVEREVFNTRHQSGVKIDNITEVIAAETGAETESRTTP